MSKPKVVILAGGSNSRFFPLNTSVHKGALEMMGETFIARTLADLNKHGFEEIVIVESARDAESGSLKKAVDGANLANLKVKFITQAEALGMGNALLTASELLGEQFLVIFPDLINAGELGEKLLELGSSAAVCTTSTEEPWLYGIVELANGYVKGIEEKPAKGSEKSDQKILGCYLLDRQFLDILGDLPAAEYNFEEALDILFKKEQVKALELSVPILSLKYPWHLFEFRDLLFAQQKSQTASTATVAASAIIDDSHGPVVIAAGATVGDFAKISGPAYIGENCLVGDYSFVRGSVLEAGCSVGANTEVVRSIIMRDATIHFGYLADSVLGSGTKVGAGLITANKRLDRALIQTMVKGIKVETLQKAMGIITGTDAKLGIGVGTMPGVLIGSNANIYPGLVVSKNVEHDATLQKP